MHFKKKVGLRWMGVGMSFSDGLQLADSGLLIRGSGKRIYSVLEQYHITRYLSNGWISSSHPRAEWCIERVDLCVSNIVSRSFKSIRDFIVELDGKDNNVEMNLNIPLQGRVMLDSKQIALFEDLVCILRGDGTSTCTETLSSKKNRLENCIMAILSCAEQHARQNINLLRSLQDIESRSRVFQMSLESLFEASDPREGEGFDSEDDLSPEQLKVLNQVRSILIRISELASQSEEMSRSVSWLSKENQRLQDDLAQVALFLGSDNSRALRKMELELARARLRIAELEADKDALELLHSS